MQSLITPDKMCYFCFSERNLEKHHCFKGPNRKRADKDGLWCWLCPECHRGTDGVHGKNGHYKDVTLKIVAESAWLEHCNGTVEEFIECYGKNWL